jgi:hypothetical protein
MRTISQLQDYHNEIEAQRMQTALLETACQESQVVWISFTSLTRMLDSYFLINRIFNR